ncbi:hypothetical protein RD110_15175 [Rhodoferax koreense]|uniref:Uncharacterized protein n=1 Tax=Rhodoferax koreensis TaxID=1842727 RepID=A0A1P8JX83_9BURK|nr:hypothetical protein RD110_15175 [Rhodoferax koreense]
MAVCAAMCGASALADGDGGGSATVTAASGLPPPAFEIASSTATGSANLGNSNTTRLEINTWSRPAAQPALGLAVGVDTPPANWTGNRAQSSIDVGVRWRSAPVNQRRIDVVAFRRISQPNQPQDAYTLIQNADQPIYSARVEMQFKSAKFGGLTPEFGAIGMQLDGGGKVVLRSKRGGPMVYYRSSF